MYKILSALAGSLENDERDERSAMIIVPDDPGPASPADVLKANVVKVFDGDGFLANVWHPLREAWIPRIPFRFAFIDAPEIELRWSRLLGQFGG